MKKECGNFLSSHDIILKKNYIVIFTLNIVIFGKRLSELYWIVSMCL